MRSEYYSGGVVAIVMAAGYSRRFGQQDKRLARLPDGRSLLAATLARVGEAFPLRRVVLRDEDDPNALKLPSTTPIIHVSNAANGLGASLSEAISVLLSDTTLADVDAAAIFLGDMPHIQVETLCALQRLARRSRIVQPSYAGRTGHPVIFGREFWPDLEALNGDKGGKSILVGRSTHCDILKVSDPGVCWDVDTMADL